MQKLIISEEKLDTKDPAVLLSLKGTIETTNASTLEEILRKIISEKCYRIIVDLSGVSYISSAGWGIFISEIKRIRGNGGDIKLASMTREVREVFDLLEFNNILKPYATTEEAMKAFSPPVGSESVKPDGPPQS